MRFGNGLARGCARTVATMRSLPLLSPSKPGYPTASELYRARECIAPWALGLPEERTPNEYAERGRMCHTIADMLVCGNTAATIQASESVAGVAWSAVQDMIHADQSNAKCIVWPDNIRVAVRSEVGIRYRPGYPDVAEFVEREPGQRFEGWLSGTADLVYVRANGVLVVADWKFGRKDQCEPIDGCGDEDDGNLQLLFLALAFATALEITGSSEGVIVARIELRFVDEDGMHVDGRDVTWGELCAFADELGALAERIDAGGSSLPRDPFEWTSHACNRCASKAHCPAPKTIGQSLLEAATKHVESMLSGPPRDAEHAREYRDGIKALEMARDDLEERYKAFLVQNPEGVPIGLGMREVARKVERPNLVLTEAAQAAIRAKYGEGAFVSRPSIGRIRAVKKAEKKTWSAADMRKLKADIDAELKKEGLLLAPSVSTRAVIQQMKRDKDGKDKWVDYRVENDADESEE